MASASSPWPDGCRGALSLTFDDGNETQLKRAIPIMEERGLRGTFYMSPRGDQWRETLEQWRGAYDAGHEIGNHSLTHPHMNKLDAAGVQAELTKLDDEIEAIIGKRCTLFRAPFGEYNDTVILAAREAGYEVVQWNIDTIDWKEARSVETILSTVYSKLSPGSIILSHNNGYRIKDYLPSLIEHALEQGYRFVTVSELLLDGETEIDNNGMQKLKAA